MAWLHAKRAARGAQTVMGESFTYQAPGGSKETVRGCFIEEYASAELDQESGAVVMGTDPVVGIVLEDLAAGVAKTSAKVTFSDGRTFTVKRVENDGRGGSRLFLSL